MPTSWLMFASRTEGSNQQKCHLAGVGSDWHLLTILAGL